MLSEGFSYSSEQEGKFMSSAMLTGRSSKSRPRFQPTAKSVQRRIRYFSTREKVAKREIGFIRQGIAIV